MTSLISILEEHKKQRSTRPESVTVRRASNRIRKELTRLAGRRRRSKKNKNSRGQQINWQLNLIDQIIAGTLYSAEVQKHDCMLQCIVHII